MTVILVDLQLSLPLLPFPYRQIPPRQSITPKIKKKWQGP